MSLKHPLSAVVCAFILMFALGGVLAAMIARGAMRVPSQGLAVAAGAAAIHLSVLLAARYARQPVRWQPLMFSAMAVLGVLMVAPSAEALCAGVACSEMHLMARRAANVLLIGTPILSAGAAATDLWQGSQRGTGHK